MKKQHTGGFLKSPFNMYEGSSIDSGKPQTSDRTERKRRAEQRRRLW